MADIEDLLDWLENTDPGMLASVRVRVLESGRIVVEPKQDILSFWSASKADQVQTFE